MNEALKISELCVSHEDRVILKNLSLTVKQGTIHALMGPNGSGKSTLAYTLMGHPHYAVEAGSMICDGTDISDLSPDKRAQLGIFLAFQHPCVIPGLTVFNFLHEACNGRFGINQSVEDFQKSLYVAMDILRIDHAFAYRSVNDGFSGGEKKRLEVLQLLMLKPKLAILDEIDSGLDVDALALVARGIEHAFAQNQTMSIIIITHYQRILQYVKPSAVHILYDGTIIRSGDGQLAYDIEDRGYDEFITEYQQRS